MAYTGCHANSAVQFPQTLCICFPCLSWSTDIEGCVLHKTSLARHQVSRSGSGRASAWWKVPANLATRYMFPQRHKSWKKEQRFDRGAAHEDQHHWTYLARYDVSILGIFEWNCIQLFSMRQDATKRFPFLSIEGEFSCYPLLSNAAQKNCSIMVESCKC